MPTPFKFDGRALGPGVRGLRATGSAGRGGWDASRVPDVIGIGSSHRDSWRCRREKQVRGARVIVGWRPRVPRRPAAPHRIHRTQGRGYQGLVIGNTARVRRGSGPLSTGPSSVHHISRGSDQIAKNFSVSPSSNTASFFGSSLTPCRVPRLRRGSFVARESGVKPPLRRGVRPRRWGCVVPD
jgi:hypothetical protein